MKQIVITLRSTILHESFPVLLFNDELTLRSPRLCPTAVFAKYENQINVFSEFLEDLPDTEEPVWVLGKSYNVKTGMDPTGLCSLCLHIVLLFIAIFCVSVVCIICYVRMFSLPVHSCLFMFLTRESRAAV